MMNVLTENKPRAELLSTGKSLWDSIPRESHAEWIAPEGRLDPMVIILESNKNRDPNLIPSKYWRMLQSPFAFFRGAAAIMASDLSTTPNTDIIVQACGNCNLMNFGCYRSPEQEMVFDICDFDETLAAPWEWDVKRLATSFVILSGQLMISEGESADIAKACVRSYREHMQNYANMDFLELWHSRISSEEILQQWGYEGAKKRFERRIRKSAQKTMIDADFPKQVEISDGTAYIKDNPPILYHHSGIDQEMYFELTERIFGKYREALDPHVRSLIRHYALQDVAVKVSGIASVGTRCGVLLLASADGEPLFLQMREAHESIFEAHVGQETNRNHAERIVSGQRLIQACDDIFLGSVEVAGRYYYFRQMREIKIMPRIELFDGESLRGFARLCGWALARAHAKSRQAALISGYMGDNTRFEDAITRFATAYDRQNMMDFESFQRVLKRRGVL
jgi:uncharacterized protein (DUF2252 family)